MYKKCKSEQFKFRNSIITPLFTLKNEYGNIAHVDKNGNNYYLFIKSKDGDYVQSNQWFEEAIIQTNVYILSQIKTERKSKTIETPTE